MTTTTIRACIVSTVTLISMSVVYGGAWYLVSLREATFRAQAEEQAHKAAHAHEASRLLALFAETEDARTALHTYMLADDGVVNFLSSVERMGRTLGLSVVTKAATVEKGDAASSFETLAVTLEIEGSYTRVMRMIQVIEKLPYQVAVRSVLLDKKRDTLSSEAPSANGWKGVITIAVTKEKSL